MAYNFNGSSNRISAGNVVDKNWNDPWSISFWMRAGAQSTDKFVVCKMQSSGNYTGYGIVMLSTHKIVAFAHSSPSLNIYMSGGTNVNTNQWLHVLATKNNASSTTSFQIYINGAAESLSLIVGNTHTSSTLSNANFSIGSRNNAELFFNGNLAEVAVWGAELSSADAASLAKGMTPEKVRPQSLELYAPLVRNVFDQTGFTLTNSGATVSDHPRIYA